MHNAPIMTVVVQRASGGIEQKFQPTHNRSSVKTQADSRIPSDVMDALCSSSSWPSAKPFYLRGQGITTLMNAPIMITVVQRARLVVVSSRSLSRLTTDLL